LLDSWADIHAVNNRGDTVLMTQVDSRKYEIIDLLLKEKLILMFRRNRVIMQLI